MTIAGAEGRIRSFRCDDDDYGKAKRRAEADGLTTSQVMRALLHAYATGELEVSRPKVIMEVSK